MILTDIKRDGLLFRLRKVANERGVDGEGVGMIGRAFKSVAVKQENAGFEIEGIATTDDVDCDREVVLPDALDWYTMGKYKALYADHMYGSRHAVAVYRWAARTKTPNGWRIRARLLPDDYSEEIPRMRTLAEHGALGWSIGFMARERGAPTDAERRSYPGAESIVRKAEVFEVSLTPMPCNLACMGVSVYADDSKAASVGDLVRKGLLPASFAQARRRIIVA